MNISPNILSRLAPFHVGFGRDLKTVRIGPSFHKLFPGLAVGDDITRFLRRVRPDAELDFESLRASQGSLILLGSHKSRILLRGQMLAWEGSNTLIFAGAPVFTISDELVDLGLSIADFALHDPVVDYLFLLQSVRITLNEAQSLTEQLTYLSEAGRQLSNSLDINAVLACTVKLAVPRLAEGCIVFFQGEEGSAVLTASLHSDPAAAAKLAALEKGLGGLSLAMAPTLAEALRANGFSAHALLPLQNRDRSLGALLLVSGGASEVFPPKQLALAEQLAHRIASSLDNARLYVESQRAVRLRDNFLAIASHELKTPLTSISMQVQFIRDLLENDKLAEFPKQKLIQMLQHSEREIDRFTELTRNLLELSRISSDELQLNRTETPLSLTDLVEGVIGRFRPDLAATKCEVVLELDDSIHGIWDALRLEQVITNLLTNAMRYGSGRPIRIRTWATGKTAHLTIADEGIGIAPADQKRIFERFERAASVRAYGGLGLGLYIVKQIVLAHGGEISVTSELMQGAVFKVSLPV